MNKYNNLAKRLELEMLNQYENTMHYINSNETTLKSYLTPARLKLYEAGEMPREKAQAYAISRADKKLTKALNERLDLLQSVSEAVGTIDHMSITVEWTRSATWGNNPKAGLDVYYTVDNERKYAMYTSPSIGGCGYDKESTAVANVLNQCPQVKRFLYELAENSKPNFYDGGYAINYRDTIGYGSGYGVLPYFEGGVGVSCFRSIFEKNGYRWSHVSSGKTFDVYNITKAEN